MMRVSRFVLTLAVLAALPQRVAAQTPPSASQLTDWAKSLQIDGSKQYALYSAGAPAVPVTLPYLTDMDPATRSRAAWVIYEIVVGYHQTKEIDSGPLLQSVMASFAMGSPERIVSDPSTTQNLLAIVQAFGPRAISAAPDLAALLTRIRSTSAQQAANIIDVLAALGPGAIDAVPAVFAAIHVDSAAVLPDSTRVAAINSLSDEDAYVFRAALHFLLVVKAHSPATIPLLTAALSSQYASRAVCEGYGPLTYQAMQTADLAGYALAAMGNDGARALLAAAADTNDVRRANAACALALVRSPAAIDAMVRVASDTTTYGPYHGRRDSRRVAIHALAASGEAATSSVPFLFTVANSTDALASDASAAIAKIRAASTSR